MTRQICTHPPGWGRQGVRILCTVLRTLLDLWGGINGHGVNMRDQCGVCDDVKRVDGEE